MVDKGFGHPLQEEATPPPLGVNYTLPSHFRPAVNEWWVTYFLPYLSRTGFPNRLYSLIEQHNYTKLPRAIRRGNNCWEGLCSLIVRCAQSRWSHKLDHFNLEIRTGSPVSTMSLLLVVILLMSPIINSMNGTLLIKGSHTLYRGNKGK